MAKTRDYLFEFFGYGQKIGEVTIDAKDIAEAYAEARRIACQNRFVTSIKHGRGIYNV